MASDLLKNLRVQLVIRTVERILADQSLRTQHTHKETSGRYVRVRNSSLLTGHECEVVRAYFASREEWMDVAVKVIDHDKSWFKNVRVTEVKLWYPLAKKETI